MPYCPSRPEPRTTLTAARALALLIGVAATAACSEPSYDAMPLISGSFVGQWRLASGGSESAPEQITIRLTDLADVPGSFQEQHVYGHGTLEWGEHRCAFEYRVGQLAYLPDHDALPWQSSSVVSGVSIMPATMAGSERELLYVSEVGNSAAWQYERVGGGPGVHAK